MMRTAAPAGGDFDRPGVRTGMARDRRAGIRTGLRRRRVQELIASATAILLLLPCLSSGQESGTGCTQKNLISITPPIVGYSSVEGTIYDALPVSVERAVQERIGLRLKPSLIYYNSAYQAYSLFLSLPIYLEACTAYRSYHGFYGAPLLALMVDRLPVRTEVLRGGIEGGYLWPVGSDMQFTLGLWHVFDAPDYQGGSSGLTISYGFWF